MMKKTCLEMIANLVSLIIAEWNFFLHFFIKNHFFASSSQPEALPYLAMAYLYDGVVQFAKAVTRLYYERVNLDPSVTVLQVSRDGPAIVEKLKNFTFKSTFYYYFPNSLFRACIIHHVLDYIYVYVYIPHFTCKLYLRNVI